MLSKLSRRTVIAGTTAIAAVAAVPAVATAIAIDGPDPIFAAMERYRDADAAFLARASYEDRLADGGQRLTRALDDHRTPEMVACVTTARAARLALASTSPSTPAGLAAYLDFLASQTEELCEFFYEEGEETETFIHSIARSARGMGDGAASVPAIALPAVAAISASLPDPILAAIEEHRRAWGPEFDLMTRKGNEEAPQEFYRLLDSVDVALLNIAPTTIGGVAAILAYAVEFVTTYAGAGWPDGEAWIDRHKLPWEVILHKNLAKTLQAMAVQS